jgi:hypothetical protein
LHIPDENNLGGLADIFFTRGGKVAFSGGPGFPQNGFVVAMTACRKKKKGREDHQ